MDKNVKRLLIVAGVVAAAWLAYSWWSNRQSGGSGTQLGSNLNSIAPELIAGSTGPSSGLTYNAGAINLYYSQPITQQSSGSNPPVSHHKLNPGGPSVPKVSTLPFLTTTGGFRQ